MNTSRLLIGERSPTIVAALFHDRRSASDAAELLRRRTALPERDVSVLGPEARPAAAARQLEPEQAGIWRTLWRSHLVLALVGAGVGLLVALLVISGVQWPAAVASPRTMLLVCAGFGAVAGMLAAGLLTLRPDHDPVIRRVHDTLADGGAAVVAHPHDEATASAASAVLQEAGGEVLRSL